MTWAAFEPTLLPQFHILPVRLVRTEWNAPGSFTYSLHEQRKLLSLTGVLKFGLSLKIIPAHIIKYLYYEKTQNDVGYTE